MKKSLVVILSLLLAVNVFSATKKTGWGEYGLKGKVKERIKIDYDIKNKFGEDVKETTGKVIEKYDDEGKRVEEILYNAKGDLTIKAIYKDGGGYESYSKDGVLLSKSIPKYDDKGNRIEWADYDKDGALTYKIIYKYDYKGNNDVTETYSKGLLDSTSYYKYDDKGNRIEDLRFESSSCTKSYYKYNRDGKLIEDAYYGRNGALYRKSIFKYDDKGNNIEKAEYDDAGGVVSISTYKYDYNGNVIECAKTDKNVLSKLTITSYTYY